MGLSYIALLVIVARDLFEVARGLTTVRCGRIRGLRCGH